MMKISITLATKDGHNYKTYDVEGLHESLIRDIVAKFGQPTTATPKIDEQHIIIDDQCYLIHDAQALISIKQQLENSSRKIDSTAPSIRDDFFQELDNSFDENKIILVQMNGFQKTQRMYYVRNLTELPTTIQKLGLQIPSIHLEELLSEIDALRIEDGNIEGSINKLKLQKEKLLKYISLFNDLGKVLNTLRADYSQIVPNPTVDLYDENDVVANIYLQHLENLTSTSKKLSQYLAAIDEKISYLNDKASHLENTIIITIYLKEEDFRKDRSILNFNTDGHATVKLYKNYKEQTYISLYGIPNPTENLLNTGLRIVGLPTVSDKDGYFTTEKYDQELLNNAEKKYKHVKQMVVPCNLPGAPLNFDGAWKYATSLLDDSKTVADSTDYQTVKLIDNFNLLTNNCSTQVAKVLAAAGAGEYCPYTGAISENIKVDTPKAAYDYAVNLNNTLNNISKTSKTPNGKKGISPNQHYMNVLYTGIDSINSILENYQLSVEENTYLKNNIYHYLQEKVTIISTASAEQMKEIEIDIITDINKLAQEVQEQETFNKDFKEGITKVLIHTLHRLPSYHQKVLTSKLSGNQSNTADASIPTPKAEAKIGDSTGETLKERHLEQQRLLNYRKQMAHKKPSNDHTSVRKAELSAIVSNIQQQIQNNESNTNQLYFNLSLKVRGAINLITKMQSQDKNDKVLTEELTASYKTVLENLRNMLETAHHEIYLSSNQEIPSKPNLVQMLQSLLSSNTSDNINSLLMSAKTQFKGTGTITPPSVLKFWRWAERHACFYETAKHQIGEVLSNNTYSYENKVSLIENLAHQHAPSIAKFWRAKERQTYREMHATALIICHIEAFANGHINEANLCVNLEKVMDKLPKAKANQVQALIDAFKNQYKDNVISVETSFKSDENVSAASSQSYTSLFKGLMVEVTEKIDANYGGELIMESDPTAAYLIAQRYLADKKPAMKTNNDAILEEMVDAEIQVSRLLSH